MKYIPRLLEKFVSRTSKSFKVVYLGGPRQVGKTTLLKKLSEKENRTYVTLDDLSQRRLAKSDPHFFIEQLKLPAIIDEVQYAPELFSAIKKIVDESDVNGQFWLTGSQQFNLIKNIQESLAGRVAILDLLGLSQKEKPKLKPIFEDIFEGSFPVFQQKNKPDRNTFFNSYVQTYLDRDLSDVFGITKQSEFNRFIEVCAARTAQVLNISDMARDGGIPVSTAVEWLSILEATKQVYLLRPYYPNITKRIIKAPKLYFLDTGLASFLTKWDSSDNLKAGAMSGAIFETYIISEFIKKYINKGKEPPLYYIRDKEGHEVDLLVHDNGIHMYEIKIAVKTDTDFEKNMNYFEKKSKDFKSKTIISLIKEPIKVTGGIEYIPYNQI